MVAAEWSRVVEVFNAAREKSGPERGLLLDSACGCNTLLRKSVEELLKGHDFANSFLSEPLFSSLTREPLPSRVVPGQQFEQYVAVAPLGRGGMGEVWVADDRELERPVALKFLAPEAASGHAVERLRREARTVSALNHPNIVTVHEVIAHGGAPIIVMELVDGKSLRELCGTRQPLAELIHMGVQIAHALSAAHGRGIIHRDIKPENILVRPDGYVKVLDFGLAGQFEAGTLPADGNLTGATLPGGTLRYMSPEQARGEALTPASDIFSFGLVLYEIATGQHAFPRDSAAEVMTAIVTEQVDAPPSVNPLLPRRLDSLILSMLAREPGARPSAEDVARTLAELQRPRESVVAVRRKKWIAAVVMLTLSTFAVWFWKYHGTAEKEPTFYQVTTLVPENRATAAAISPDAKWTAYANVDGIFLRSMRNGETEALRAPADFTVDHLAWFADGTKLVASGFSDTSYVPSVWTISAGGAPPCLLRGHARRAIPSPDGKHIAFISQDSSELWVMRSDGLEARRLVNAAGDMLPLLFWLPNGQRLGFQRHHIWAGHSMRSYQSVALTTGSIATLVRNIEMSSASMLPDGRLLYLQWDNWDFTTSRQLWEVRTDPLTGAFVERPQEIAALPGNNYTLLDLSVSADGKRAMVLRRSDENTVFVATLIDIRPASRISAG